MREASSASSEYVRVLLAARRSGPLQGHMVYVLVEFQSRSDRFMAVRVLTYVGLLYQELIKASSSRELGKSPAILPIVKHSGQKRWSASEDISSLVSAEPSGLCQ
jgi:hypothetical protein